MNRKDRYPLSAVVIAKNEAPRIGICLGSLSFCDEILVVDNGSTDGTPDIARKMGASVVTTSETSFARLRMIGKTETSGKWILYVDADERVPSELKKEIRDIVAKSEPGEFAAYYLRRTNAYLGRVWPVGDRMQRLFLREKLVRWYGEVHETAEVDGNVGVLDNPLFHDTHRDLRSMVDKTNEWSETEAKLRFDAHHPEIVPWRIVRVMLTAFWGSYVGQSGWKAGTEGIIESVFQAFSMFVTYAKLWELQRQKGKNV